jgi:peptidase M64-like protein
MMKRILLIATAILITATSVLAAPATMRVDYYHTGNDKEERFSLDRIVIEPLPWAGNVSRSVDKTNLGKYFFEVVDAASGTTLYSRGFASV